MRLSVKAQYGLSAMIYLAQRHPAGECVTVINLSNELKISKIYLEQVFALLKRAGLVVSTKGAQGGYQLALSPKDISACDILGAIETPLFEKTTSTVTEGNRYIEQALREAVYEPLDNGVKQLLAGVTLEALVTKTQKQSWEDGFMYYL